MTILLALAIALPAASGLAAVALQRHPDVAQRAASAMLCAGAALGLVAAAIVLAGGGPAEGLGLRLDALSAAFLAPIAIVCAAGALYGLAYFPQVALRGRAIRVEIFFGLATAGMLLLVSAANAFVFLVGWEVMALSGFLLVHTRHERRDVQRAAFVYLAATHVGTLTLFALFALLHRAAGTWDFSAMAGLSGAGPLAAPIFLLALLGFGLKAGLMPVHFWLPGAHAAAPSHVSAILSGVLLKTGIYGLLRVTGLFDAPPASWGLAVLVVGGVSAVLGVAFALAQHDLKRLLAYHSVENVGIIALGAGLALLGRAHGEPGLVLLGIAGAALHVTNHALFKSLLFFGAGAIEHATGTRELDLLGGLARRMPRTARLFLVGAAAICGLPPLNGFVSEWMVYLGFLGTMRLPRGDLGGFAVLGAPALALVGGLAAACFAKVFGVVFLGTGRSEHAGRAHEAPWEMRAPMAALAIACALIGLFPAALAGPLARVAGAWSRLPAARLLPEAERAASAAWRISAVAAVLLLLAVAIVAARRRLGGADMPATVETWGCAFSAPTARMQYTGSSFAELLVRRFSWVLFPRVRRARVAGPFPGATGFRTHVPDTVLDLTLDPAARGVRWLATRLRLLYVTRVQLQILFVIATLVAVLAWGFLLP